MALINTVAEVKSLIPNFISNLSDEASLPNFELFDAELLIPICGIALYEDLQTKKAGNTLSADEQTILKKMQMVSVCNAYAQSIALGHITITDTGAKKFSTKDTTPVAKWEIDKTQKALYLMALSGVDALVSYLLYKKPVLWLTSEYYLSTQNLLIKTGEDFNRYYKLRHPAATYFSIRNRIADAQTIFLKDILSVNFLQYLSGSTAPVAIATQIADIKKALCYFTIYQCCQHDNVDFGAEGFTVVASSEDQWGAKTQAPGLDVDLKARACERDANSFLNRARYELVQYYHRSDADAGFKAMLDASPLKDYLAPELAKSGNERRRGIFRF
ncbi:DUF6712 family protein [Niabella sp. 22666]|uniref:DUF6712 family protein n=1 Tax=Niabella sp. 22666 TaxID=3453954 RepID=UPI003F82FC7C